ncbi:DNA-dependent ATPase fun30 [Coemansia sp. RSA 1200]|nr:DNA-dependent ATPase fun30 [Coemansia sp. RSA 1200]
MKKITDYMRRPATSPEPVLAPDTPEGVEDAHSSQSSTLEPTDSEELVVLQSSPGRPGTSRAIRVDQQRNTASTARLGSFNFRGGKPAAATNTTPPQSADYSLPSSPLGLGRKQPRLVRAGGARLTASSIDLAKMDIGPDQQRPGDSDSDSDSDSIGNGTATPSRKRRIADLDSPDNSSAASAMKRATPTPTYTVSDSGSDDGGESVDSSATAGARGARRGRLLRGSRKPPARTQASIVVGSDSDSESDSLDGDATAGVTFERRFERIEPHILRLFNEASAEELAEKTGATAGEARTIIGMRRFESVDAVEQAMRRTRGVRLALFNQYRDTLLGHAEVEAVISQCAGVYTQLKAAMRSAGIVSNEATGAVSIGEGVQLTQPAMINNAFSLKSYQLEGVEWLTCLRNARASGILADEMGLGKTFQVIAFLCRGIEDGSVRLPSLVVCPSSTLDNWLNECARFAPKLRVAAYYGSQAERSALQQTLGDESSYDVLVTTYNIATGNKLDRVFLKRRRFHALILDEGHMVKNCMSSRYKWLAQIRTPFRLLLTGTPLQNNLQELVSLLTFIMPQVFAESQPTLTHAFKMKPAQRVRAQPADSDDATSSVAPSGAQTPVPATSGAAASSRGAVDTQHINQAKVLLRPFVLRRRKCDVLGDLPLKTEHLVRLDLTASQRALYDTIAPDPASAIADGSGGDIRTALADLDTANLDSTAGGAKATNGGSNNNSSWISMFMDMRKAADHPLLLRSHYKPADLVKMAKGLLREPDYAEANYQYVLEDMEVCSDFELHKLCVTYPKIGSFKLPDTLLLDSAKVQRLKTIVNECVERGEKMLVFSQFTTMLNILESVFAIWNITYRRLDGQTKVDERQAMIDEFNTTSAASVPVFLLSTKAGGFGINLTSANVVVIYDSGNNPSEERQAEDRAHRVGQTKDVRVYKLIASGTIDEDILESSRSKQLVEHMFWF